MYGPLGLGDQKIRKQGSQMPHVERARQGVSWGLMETARFLSHPTGGPTKLSHAGPGWVQGSGPRQASERSALGPQGGSGRAREHSCLIRGSGLRQGDRATHIFYVYLCQRSPIGLVTPGQCSSDPPQFPPMSGGYKLPCLLHGVMGRLKQGPDEGLWV